MEQEIQEELILPPEEASENQADAFAVDWAAIKAVNPEVVGWIRFDNPGRISYPIVQGQSNQFYLNRNWKKQYHYAGAIFLHKANNPDFTDANSIIYGHRMMGGSMFGSLDKYASYVFMRDNPYFYIYTPDGKRRTYEIFACAQVKDGSSTYGIRFKTTKERLEQYAQLKKHAIAKKDIELDEFDTTITLSTCANRGYYNRIVLEGKLIAIDIP